MSDTRIHPADHPVFAQLPNTQAFFRATIPAPATTPDEAFRLASLYDINDDAEFDPRYDEEEPWFNEDEDGELAYARMLEARAERGSWFGRDPEGW